ncbi:MAG: hypothetical protein K0R25_974, partial [Rickettsiaceae bacterium]|nr:hypothetical protein [Rickettsiaceae bacterium]
MQKLLKISESLRQFFLKEEKDNKYNYFALAIAAGVGHIFFGFYWTYIDPQIYENLYLRSVGFLTCVILLSAAALKREESQNKWLYYYWIFTVIYNLPFFFTINLILNNFSDIWFVAEATMIFTTVLFLSSIILSLLTIFSGIFFAAIFCFFTSPNSIYFSQDIIKHLPIYSLTFIAAYVFSYSNNKGLALSKDVIYGQELKILKSLAGSIAHELRNPLNTINLIGSQIKDLAPEFDKTNVENSGDAKSKLLSLTSHITDATSNANNIINIILGDLSEKKINPEDFSYLNPAKALPEILEKYGYKNDEERAKINLLLPETGKENEEGNFLFKAVPDRFTYIIFNLLKNALYYLDQYPNSTITIGTDKKEVNGTQYNTIYIHDTGPGIATNAIPKLFGDFYTSGKKEGTGLGLAFCKRNMKLFGGDIICESELGKW